MIIREAQIADAPIIAEHLLIALETIVYQFIGKVDDGEAIAFLQHFIEAKNNQYTYQHCYVAELDHKIVAAAVVYDGAKLDELRNPVFEYIKKQYHLDMQMDPETQAGEFYLDTIAVNRKHQGQGIGTKLLQFIINKYVHQQKQTLGLLVNADNPAAKKLYLRLGFKYVGKRTLLGNVVEHLSMSNE